MIDLLFRIILNNAKLNLSSISHNRYAWGIFISLALVSDITRSSDRLATCGDFENRPEPI